MMAAVLMRLAVEFRARRRAWLSVAILIGLFGGAVAGAVAGARRTDSVVDRHVARWLPPDIFFAPVFGVTELGPELAEALGIENLLKLGSVADGSHAFEVPNAEELDVLVTDDPRLGTEIFENDLIEGRLPDPDEPEEALINVITMQKLGLSAGDQYTFRLLTNLGFEAEPKPAGEVRVRITGVTEALGDFSAIAGPGFTLTPAFLEKYRDRFDDIEQVELSMLRLREGAASYDEFAKEIDQVTEGKSVFYFETAAWSEARRSFGLQADALWILAGVLAVVTILILGQTISRQTFVESGDHGTLRSLGFTGGQLTGLGILRAAAVGAVAGVIAVVVVAAASPLTPFGNARIADPDPSFSLPFVVATLTFAAVGVIVAVLAIIPSWRAARLSGSPAEHATARPARISERASRTMPGPAASVGIRMAFEQGHGSTAVPVRTTIVATAIGVLALIAALVTGASLDHLTDDPALYGWTWDVAAIAEAFDDNPDEPGAAAEARTALQNLRGIAAVTFGPEGGQLLVNGVTVEPLGLPAGATVTPPILEGRAPAAPDEIAVARNTLRAAGAEIGDTVSIGFQGTAKTAPFRVVGVTVLPLAGEASQLGDGVWLPIDDLERLFGEPIPIDRALIRFESSADRKALEETIVERFGAEIRHPEPPGTVVDFGAVAQMPYVLAGIVGALAVGTLGQGLVTAVRRRRRDLSILKALGLDRRQVRAAVAWQASATALATLVVAVPLGIIAGRFVWSTFAGEIGFVSQPVVRAAFTALLVPVAILIANVIAALPGRLAARTRPAVVLRTE
jgi:ABC-type lipoprotein release transport system permease subunit